MSKHLSKSARLEELTKIARCGLQEAARAVYEIHEDKLYLETHSTFEEWLQQELGLQRRRGYELIEAHVGFTKIESVPNVRNSAHSVSASAAVEIAKVPDEKVAEVVEKATEGGTKPMTAAAVKRVKGELMPPEPQTEPEVYDVWEEVDPPEPKNSKVDQFRKLRSMVKQHANQMIRAVDDMQAIRCNPGTHKKLLALFESIHSLIDGWPE